MNEKRGANQRLWFRKRAIPVFPHRLITVEKVRDVTVGGNQLIVTYSNHPALDLMVTFKELKEVLVEQCFPHLRTTAKDTFTTEEIEAPEVIEFKKGTNLSLASKRINYDDDIFDFPEENFPSHWMDCVRGPARGYTEEQLNAYPWLALEPPTSIEPYQINEYNDRYTSRFRDWVKGQLRIGGNGPLEEREFDKEKFKKFLGVKVYYVDASKGRVGPELVEQDEDRYEFSHDEWTWYSTSTGLAAVV